jgi:hypothetical protein
MHFLPLIHKFLILWKTFRVSNIFHPISKFKFGFNQILIKKFVDFFRFFFFIFVFYMITNTFQVPLSFWNSFFDTFSHTDSFLQYLAWQRTSFGSSEAFLVEYPALEPSCLFSSLQKLIPHRFVFSSLL